MKQSKEYLLLLIIMIAFVNFFYAQNEVWNHIQPTPQEHNLNCIRQIPGTETIVAVGDGSTIMYSNDGGETWDPIDIPCSSGLTHVYFYDEWHGFVFGNNGVIMETLTGGVVDVPENPSRENKPFFTLSPNPVRNQLKIELTEETKGNLYLEIYDLNGEKVMTDKIQGTSFHNNYLYNVSSLPSGLYFVRIKSGNKVSSSKFVKL